MNSPIRQQDMCDQKPWLTPWEQVSHLKSKGVHFRYMSEAEAVEYLTKNNNYFRLRSYRTGFPKVSDGKRKGEYVNLDFKMLVDLSIIDMLLRNEMISLTLDIEHFCKVDLLGRIEQHAEDGYEIVQAYLREQDTFDRKGVTILQAFLQNTVVLICLSGPFWKLLPLAPLIHSFCFAPNGLTMMSFAIGFICFARQKISATRVLTIVAFLMVLLRVRMPEGQITVL